MKKVLVFSLVWLCSLLAQADFSIKALHCGPRGSFLGALASDLAIPDYFPPEQYLVRMLAEPILGDLSICDQFEPVYLGQSCQAHDQCYYTLGANKETCDQDLYEGWINSCHERYYGASYESAYCNNVCVEAVEFMYGALRYDVGGFCPSCTAFAFDQTEAYRRTIR